MSRRQDMAGRRAGVAGGMGAGKVSSTASEQSMERCAELEAALEGLKARYEQYFLGLLRLPPHDEHEAVRRGIQSLRQTTSRNTGVRFRAQSIQNRLLSYERMWQRICREIEEGTWRRDLFKARLRGPRATGNAGAMGAAAAGPTDRTVRETGSQQGGAAEGVRAEPAPPGPGAGPQQAGATARVGGRTESPAGAVPGRPSGADLSDERLRPLYDAWIQARRRCRESTEGLSYESLAANLRKQVPELLQKHGASSVELKVIIKDGKAAVRASPK